MSRLRIALAAATTLVVGLGIAGTTSAPASASGTPSSVTPCGVAASPPTRFDHVVVVVFENHNYGSIIDNAASPYLSGLANRCGSAADMTAATHPSLPNYLNLTSGSTKGITDDDPPSAHKITGASMFSVIGDWRALEEGMPSNCALTNSGDYAVKHNPAAYYTDLRAACLTRDVPLASTPDLSARFTLVEPSMCHSMHDCSVSTGDTWAKGFLTKVLDSAEYRGGRTAVMVTFDENEDHLPGNHIPTIIITPSVRPGTVVTTAYDHCSLQRTIERMLQNPGPYHYTGCAASASSMRPAFNS